MGVEDYTGYGNQHDSGEEPVLFEFGKDSLVPFDSTLSPQAQPEIEGDSSDEDDSGLSIKHSHLGDTALKSTIIAIESQPWFNDLPRAVLAGAVALTTKNPYLAATVYTGSTVLLEGAAAIAAPDVLKAEEKGRTYEIIQKVLDNKALKYVFPSKGEKVSLAREGMVALYLGTTWQTGMKNREDEGISREQLRNRGLIASVAMVPLVFAEGFLGSASLANLITDPIIAVSSALGLGAIFTGVNTLKNRILGRAPKKSKEIGETNV